MQGTATDSKLQTTTKPKQAINNKEIELLKKASVSGDSEASLKLYKLYAGLDVSGHENKGS